MKNLWGLAITTLLLFLAFSSCKDDDEEPMNPTTADINTIENDEQFIDFVKETFTLADQITNYDRARELNEKLENNTISDSELSELATLVGFTSWTAVETYALARYEAYEALQNKYGFTANDTELLTDKSLAVFDALSSDVNKAALAMKVDNFDCDFEDAERNCREEYIDCVRFSIDREFDLYEPIPQFCFPPAEDGADCYTPSELGSFYIRRSYTQAQCLSTFHCCLLEFGGCAEQDELSRRCRINQGPSFNF